MLEYKGKCVIVTFFYKQQSYLAYCHSIVMSVIVLERLGIKWDYWTIAGNFHMENCVNDTLTRVLNDDTITDVIIVDSDESWNPNHLIRLLMHEEEIVCGVYRTTEKKINYPVILKNDSDGSHIGKMLPDGNCLLLADRVPAGFMKVSKLALQKWVNAYPDKWSFFDGKKTHTFFGNEFRNHIFYGMDFCFADSMRACGIKIYVDPICDITHWGLSEYKGTLDAYLRALKANQEAGNAFAIVEQMAKDIEARNG